MFRYIKAFYSSKRRLVNHLGSGTVGAALITASGIGAAIAGTVIRNNNQVLIGSGRLSFGSPQRLTNTLGVEPGAVTPFAVINDVSCQVTVILDAEMMAAELANFHPLINDMTTTIAPSDLLRFIADCGHEPRIVDLSLATRKDAVEY